MLVRLLGASFAAAIGSACAIPALAADVATKPTAAPIEYLAQMPAVDGFNSKFEAFGGSLSDRGFFGGAGSLSIPLQQSYGLQVDFTAASLDNDFFGAASGHLFWRDPSRGLLGFYASTNVWNHAGGLNSYHFGVEGGWYLDRWSIDGVAGIEGGNSGHENPDGGTFESFDIRSRFFDQVDFSYYLNDNFKLYVGHRYLGGENSAALGSEWGLPLGGGRMASLFAEGRIGENDFHGVWGGLRFYLGQRDKTLIQRHRQDDPKAWDTNESSTLTSSGHQDKNDQKKCVLGAKGPAAVKAFICAAPPQGVPIGCCPV